MHILHYEIYTGVARIYIYPVAQSHCTYNVNKTPFPPLSWEQERMGITTGNGNKTRLNLGSKMGMNHWEWEGIGLKKTFPLISAKDPDANS